MAYSIKYHEDSDGRMHLQYTGDAQAIVDAAAAEARGHREHGRFSGRSEFRKVLEMDPIVLMQIAQENGLAYFDPKVMEIAMGRDYSKFRTTDDSLIYKRYRNVR